MAVLLALMEDLRASLLDWALSIIAWLVLHVIVAWPLILNIGSDRVIVELWLHNAFFGVFEIYLFWILDLDVSLSRLVDHLRILALHLRLFVGHLSRLTWHLIRSARNRSLISLFTHELILTEELFRHFVYKGS